MNLKKIAVILAWVLSVGLASALTFEVRASNCVVPPATLICASTLALNATLAWFAVLYLTVVAAFPEKPEPDESSASVDVKTMHWL